MAALDLVYESQRSLARLRPRILERVEASRHPAFPPDILMEILDQRLELRWTPFFLLLHRLYGQHYDFFYYLEKITLTAINSWVNRPDPMMEQDRRREFDPQWYLSQEMVGMSLYVDLFSGDLRRLKSRIPYLRELGITYLHLMPLFASPPGNNDGGYAVSDYRTVDPRLGTIDDLKDLSAALREAGISLVLDFVFNHTADDHPWALRAREGEREYRDFYLTFPDRTMPDRYEKNLREIFPTVRRGNFTWHDGMKRWVWTTFNSFQWDLNYANPAVFCAMAGELLFLANCGVEILRLDAVAFIWKQLGTACENLPEAHLVIQAFNSLCRIAAPGLIFKSEAIVHPDEVAKYIKPEECQLSYNPTLMALLWEASATRDTRLLRKTLETRQAIPSKTIWVNYLRGHDDIGWSFDNGDAWSVGINPEDHRDFLNRFYTGMFPGAFARGVPFQHNEDTGDMRISGTMASLAGLEQGVELEREDLLEMAIRRMRMLYGVLFSAGGIPLLFMGEEWGRLNDYTFEDDPEKADDSRWVHRVRMDWEAVSSASRVDGPPRRLYREVQKLILLRKDCLALSGSALQVLPINNNRVLAYLRLFEGSRLAVLANFSEAPQLVALQALRSEGLTYFARDLITDTVVPMRRPLALEPYQVLWLQED